MKHAAGVLIKFGNMGLLGKRSYKLETFQGFWSIPCGIIERGESAEEAAIREVYEETNLALSQPLDFLGEFSINQSSNFYAFKIDMQDLLFPEPEAKDAFEHTEWGYFKIEKNCLPLPMCEKMAEMLLWKH